MRTLTKKNKELQKKIEALKAIILLEMADNNKLKTSKEQKKNANEYDKSFKTLLLFSMEAYKVFETTSNPFQTYQESLNASDNEAASRVLAPFVRFPLSNQ